MVDLPAGQERPLDLERAPFVVAADEKEPLPRSDQQQHAHTTTLDEGDSSADIDRGPGAFLHEEPNYAVVAALREDGTPHQTSSGSTGTASTSCST